MEKTMNVDSLKTQIEKTQEQLKALRTNLKDLNKKDKKPLKGEMVKWVTKAGYEVEGHGVLYYYVTKDKNGNGPFMREATQAQIVKA